MWDDVGMCWECLLNLALDLCALLVLFGLSLVLELDVVPRVAMLVSVLWLAQSVAKGIYFFMQQGGCECEENP